MLTASELLNQTIKLLENERSNESNLNNLVVISENIVKKYGIDPENHKYRGRKAPKRLDDDYPQTTYQLARCVRLL